MPIQNTKSQRDKRQAIVADDQFGRPWMFKIETESLDITADIQPGGRWIQTPVGQRRDGSPIYSNGIDPLRTPQKYFKLARTRNNRPDLGRIVVDFNRWIQDQKQALRDWVTHLWTVGQQLNPGAKTVKDVEQDPRCLHWAGQKPWPTVRVLELAQKGNPELLGLKALSPSTQKLLKQVDVETILREELEEFTPAELAAFGLLEQDTSARRDVETVGMVPPEPVDESSLDTWPKFFGHHSKLGLTMAEIAPKWKEHKKQMVAPTA